MKVWMLLMIWIIGLAMSASIIVLSFLYAFHVISMEDLPQSQPVKQYVPRERVKLYFDKR